MQGREDLLDIILEERPDVLNHNVETVPSLYFKVRPQANFERSLAVLRYAKEKGFKTKSGIMVGLGEREDEVIDVMKRLREGDGARTRPSRRPTGLARASSSGAGALPGKIGRAHV